MSSIAAGARNARYLPGASVFAGKVMCASNPRASFIFAASAPASQAKPDSPDFTALSARWYRLHCRLNDVASCQLRWPNEFAKPRHTGPPA